MRSLSGKYSIFFLIMLSVSSFILHDFIHSSFCVSVNSGILIHSGSGCAFGETAERGNGKAARADVSVSCHRPEETPADVFCPVCAGWLTADNPVQPATVLIFRCRDEISPASSALLANPKWLLPSPRAPPAA